MTFPAAWTLSEYMEENNYELLEEGLVNHLLDVAGMLPIPGVASASDFVNMILFAKKKKWLDAGISAMSLVAVIGDIIGKGGKWIMKIMGANIKALSSLPAAVIKKLRSIHKWFDEADDEGGKIDMILDKIEELGTHWPEEGLNEGWEDEARKQAEEEGESFMPSGKREKALWINKKAPWFGKIVKSLHAGSETTKGIRSGIEQFVNWLGNLVDIQSSEQEPIRKATAFMSQNPSKQVPVGAALKACKTLGGCKKIEDAFDKQKEINEQRLYEALVQKWAKQEESQKMSKKWASNKSDQLLVENFKKFMEGGDFSSTLNEEYSCSRRSHSHELRSSEKLHVYKIKLPAGIDIDGGVVKDANAKYVPEKGIWIAPSYCELADAILRLAGGNHELANNIEFISVDNIKDDSGNAIADYRRQLGYFKENK